jgi:GT2 family glycosyltransferase
LGAFRRRDITFSEWYDSKHPQISEDSDLNYRLRKLGKKVFIDSSIVAYHYPRENLSKFFRLCFNYGLGRGLFILKHKTFLAPRQFLFVTGALGFAVLGGASLLSPFCKNLVFLLIAIYLGLALALSLEQKGSFGHRKLFFLGIMGAHLCWLGGLLSSPIQYFKDLRLSNSPKIL